MDDFGEMTDKFLAQCLEHREVALGIVDKSLSASSFDAANVALAQAQALAAARVNSFLAFRAQLKKESEQNPRASFDEDPKDSQEDLADDVVSDL